MAQIWTIAIDQSSALLQMLRTDRKSLITLSWEVSFGIGDMRPIEVEWTADEAARLLGFEGEILAMRAKIPLPEEKPPSFNISIHGTHGPSTGV